MHDMADQELLILVDSQDRETGTGNKEECHRIEPRLHRAFSVFLFDREGRMLITQRSKVKSTWPLFWSNACCSHPKPGETTEQAALRRLEEELGITAEIRFLFSFEYRAHYDSQWGEHELDHVFTGRFDGSLDPNEDEVEAWQYIDAESLREDVRKNPDRYTPWFKLVFDRVLEKGE